MIKLDQYPLLRLIESPLQLRGLQKEDLLSLSEELRAFLLEALNISGGHFAGNLGTVELAVALHYVFDTPTDPIIWDVGHQAYPHKILTGRRDQITSIRQGGGLSPFCKRDESEYDNFGVGHSSTSISAALGMAIAADVQQREIHPVAVIGDGAMTAGMAFEALNHLGDTQSDVLVILNDNEMSISPNVGALSNYLTKMLSGETYTSVRERSKKILKAVPPVKALAKKTEETMKNLFAPATIFAELGCDYFGPIDGHDVNTLTDTLQNLRKIKGPKLLHVITKKGKGYAPAEADPVKYHAVKPGFLNPAKTPAKKPSLPTYSQVFGQWLCDMAAADPNLVAITPAMREGSGMVEFSEKYPERYFDVAIAEQHSVTVAAGMACEGLKPVVAIYSTFLQRAYDQFIHDVALQNLPVLFALDRAGIVGGDGPTHAGSFDISFLRCIPNIVIMTPSDENECRQMLTTGFKHNGPAAVRYPRGQGVGAAIDLELKTLEIGKADIVRQGESIAILAFGSMLAPALTAAESLNATVVNMRFVKPIDTQMINHIIETHAVIYTLEENTILGGAGSAVNEYVNTQTNTCQVYNLGLPDTFLGHGDPKQMLADIGLDAKGIVQTIKKMETA